MIRRGPAPEVLAGAAAVAAALLLTALSARSALELDPLPTPRAERAELRLAPLARRVSPSPREIAAAVDRDPFRPERTRPPVRFRSAQERLADAAAGPGTAAPGLVQPLRPEVPRLVGTMILPDGHAVALCELTGQSPRLLRRGERIGDFVLERVGRRRATFRSPQTGSIELHVPNAGS